MLPGRIFRASGRRGLGRVREVLEPPDRDHRVPGGQLVLANRAERREVIPHKLGCPAVWRAAREVFLGELADLLGEALRALERQTLVSRQIARDTKLRLTEALDETDGQRLAGGNEVDVVRIGPIVPPHDGSDRLVPEPFHRGLPVPEAAVSVKCTAVQHDSSFF